MDYSTGSSMAVFVGALILALLVGIFVGVGGGLAIIALGLLGTTIMFARSEQAAAASETSAMFQSAGTHPAGAQSAGTKAAGTQSGSTERPDPGREDDQSRPAT